MSNVSNQWCAEKLTGFLKSSVKPESADLPTDTSSLTNWLNWPLGKGAKYMTQISSPKNLYKGDIIIRSGAEDYIAVVYDGGPVSGTYKIAEFDYISKKIVKKSTTGPVAYILRIRGAYGDPGITSTAADGKKVSRRSSFLVRSGSVAVDNRLIDIIESAGMAMPDGYTTQLTSGVRPGDSRFHGRGKAIDIQLYLNGRSLGRYQVASDFRHYEIFAQKARQIQTAKYPELNVAFRFGGYFSGTRANYGALDSMHFDIGGSAGLGTGGGSWANGLTSTMRNYWVGVTSVGMGGTTLA
jgi:hypothetical protein